MIHPHTELRFISPEKGYGVVATQFIPKGTITWAFDKLDQVFTPGEIAAMDEQYQKIIEFYGYRDHNGDFVLCWDISRFVNHSFHSSCISTAYNFELAVRDIYPGEELTDDYGYLNVSEPFDCIPEPGTVRKQVLPDDLLNFHELWDEQLREAFKHFNEVEQPLAWLIEKESRQKVEEVASGKADADSILNCYYNVLPEMMQKV